MPPSLLRLPDFILLVGEGTQLCFCMECQLVQHDYANARHAQLILPVVSLPLPLRGRDGELEGSFVRINCVFSLTCISI